MHAISILVQYSRPFFIPELYRQRVSFYTMQYLYHDEVHCNTGIHFGAFSVKNTVNMSESNLNVDQCHLVTFLYL